MARKGSGAAMPTPAMALEVTVVSAEGVRVASGRPLCRGAYAVVHTASSSAPTRVDADADCHGFPYWAEAVRVALPAGAPALDVEICRARAGGGRPAAEPVAAARVPVEDFTVGPPGHLHCLSYRLFDSGGRCGARGRNGIVNITVRRLDGAPPAQGKATAPAPAAGKAVDAAGPSGSGVSCSAAAAGLEKPAAPAGAVMGYPVGC